MSQKFLHIEDEALKLNVATLQRWKTGALANDTIPHKDVIEWLKTWNEHEAKAPEWK